MAISPPNAPFTRAQRRNIMIGKVPNKANTPKKVLIRVIIVLLACAVLLAFGRFKRLADEGLIWAIPQEVQDKVDFDKLEDNIDKLQADGYRKRGWGEGERCFVEGPNKDWSAAPGINIEWYTDEQGEHTPLVQAYSQFHLRPWLSSYNNKSGYHFSHAMYIRSEDAVMAINFCSPHYFSGRRQLIEWLDEFCDKYCS